MKFDKEEAATYLGVSVRTLANWRSAGEGPVYYKPSDKLTYYFKEDLDAWIKGEGKNEKDKQATNRRPNGHCRK